MVGLSRIFFAILLSLFVIVSPAGVFAETESGAVGIEGTVSAVAPSEAPLISAPGNGTRFKESPTTVSGTCLDGLLIKIFVKDIFGGSVNCASGKFSIEVNLSPGENKIFARSYDDLEQASPDSNIIKVYLDTSSKSLTLTSDFARRSANPREELTWPILISGGSSPYAVSIDWGDGRTSLKSVISSSEFVAEHIYLYSGIYKVVVRAVDINDNRAVLQLVAVGKGKSFAPTSGPASGKTKTVVVWWPMPLFIIFMISTFWLGVRYERRRTE